MINKAKDFIKSITINLKEPAENLVMVDQPTRSKVNTNQTRKRKYTPKKVKPLRSKFETKVMVDDHQKEILKQLFVNHTRIAEKALEIKKKEPKINILVLKDRVHEFARQENMKYVIDASLNLDVHYIHKGTMTEIGEKKFIIFSEKSLSNKRFTVSNSGGEILISGVNIVLLLKDRINNMPKDKKFYMNLITSDLENLSDLTLSVFYTTRKNEEDTKLLLKENQ